MPVYVSAYHVHSADSGSSLKSSCGWGTAETSEKRLKGYSSVIQPGRKVERERNPISSHHRRARRQLKFALREEKKLLWTVKVVFLTTGSDHGTSFVQGGR